MAGQLLTRRGATRYLGVGHTTFGDLVKAGHIPVWTNPLTGRRYYSKPALDRWLEQLDDRRTA